ncbi:MAG: diacylglycerol kinase catalytic domain-containing protein [Pirellulaceae bacterium]
MGISLPNIVIVTTPTRMQGLLTRWGTKGAARFRLKQAIAHRAQVAGEADAVTLAEADFDLYEMESVRYERTIELLREGLEDGYPVTILQRQYLANYDFRNAVVVIVVGPDGLVANTAKYVGDLPIIGVNPDPARNDGVLLPFRVEQTRRAVKAALEKQAITRPVTMAQAELSDGQRLLAFNDFFVGRRSHVSARYNLRWRGRAEPQSSSGVIVATGAGSTGWLSSVFNMMRGVSQWTGGKSGSPFQMEWQERRLAWVVREPFASRHSSASIVAGVVDEGEELVVESLMPESGVIFSDGIEEDFLEFNSGSTVRITVARQQANLVVPSR